MTPPGLATIAWPGTALAYVSLSFQLRHDGGPLDHAALHLVEHVLADRMGQACEVRGGLVHAELDARIMAFMVELLAGRVDAALFAQMRRVTQAPIRRHEFDYARACLKTEQWHLRPGAAPGPGAGRYFADHGSRELTFEAAAAAREALAALRPRLLLIADGSALRKLSDTGCLSDLVKSPETGVDESGHDPLTESVIAPVADHVSRAVIAAAHSSIGAPDPALLIERRMHWLRGNPDLLAAQAARVAPHYADFGRLFDSMRKSIGVAARPARFAILWTDRVPGSRCPEQRAMDEFLDACRDRPRLFIGHDCTTLCLDVPQGSTARDELAHAVALRLDAPLAVVADDRDAEPAVGVVSAAAGEESVGLRLAQAAGVEPQLRNDAGLMALDFVFDSRRSDLVLAACEGWLHREGLLSRHARTAPWLEWGLTPFSSHREGVFDDRLLLGYRCTASCPDHARAVVGQRLLQLAAEAVPLASPDAMRFARQRRSISPDAALLRRVRATARLR